MIHLFCNWSEEERERSLAYWEQRLPPPAWAGSWQAANDNMDPPAWVLYSPDLQELLKLWIECDRDLVMLKLRWHP